MGEKRFTFFEFHFHDGPYFEATANAPGSGLLPGEDEPEAGTAAEPEVETESKSCSGKSVVKALAVAAVVVAVALVARKLLAGDGEDEGIVYE